MARPSRPAPHDARRRTYNTGITRDQIVDVALELSRAHGLEGWGTRQLLARLDTSFSVVYRLVGDRGALSAATVERVVGETAFPDEALPWRAWLTEMMLSLRAACREVPGVAHWLLMSGGATPAALARIERGVAVMREAGFGDDAMPAYAFVFTSTIGLVAMGDARGPDSPGAEPRDHARMAAELAALRAGSPSGEVAVLLDFVERLGVADADAAERASLAQFAFSLACALDGVEQRLRPHPHR